MKFERLRYLAIFCSLILIYTFSVSAQTPTVTPVPPPADDGEIIKVDSRLVVVPVSITDRSGEPVLGLKAQDFRVLEENKQQQIESISDAEKVPLEIVLLFDISASTDSMFKFEQETAAQFLRDVMRTEDRAAIFTVGIQPTVVQPRDSAAKSIETIARISPTKEQTAFYDSVKAAADYLQKNSPQGTRKVMIIISDGEDTNSEGVLRAIWNAERKIADNVGGEKLRDLRVKARDTAKAQEQVKVLKSLQNADTVFYSINPAGSSYQLNKISVFGQENMQRFADETGGTAFLPKFAPVDSKDTLQNSQNIKRNQETLTKIFRQLANELRAQYLVQYYSESEFKNGRYVKLDVGLQNPASFRVRARQGYFVKN